MKVIRRWQCDVGAFVWILEQSPKTVGVNLPCIMEEATGYPVVLCMMRVQVERTVVTMASGAALNQFFGFLSGKDVGVVRRRAMAPCSLRYSLQTRRGEVVKSPCSSSLVRVASCVEGMSGVGLVAVTGGRTAFEGQEVQRSPVAFARSMFVHVADGFV